MKQSPGAIAHLLQVLLLLQIPDGSSATGTAAIGLPSVVDSASGDVEASADCSRRIYTAGVWVLIP